MKRSWIAFIMTLAVLAGCGGDGGHHHDDVEVYETFSDERIDGDIRKDPGSGALTVTLVSRDNVTSVLAGVDPVTAREYRAFLDFPLDGLPLGVPIRSATVDIVLNSITLVSQSATIPIRIDLVSFPPPLLAQDFDDVPLASLSIVPPISSADLHGHVTVDVTPLMTVAQEQELDNFQIRISEEPGFVSPGVIEIDDSQDPDLAPFLSVTFVD